MSRPRPPLTVILRSGAFWVGFAVTTVGFGLVIGGLGWLMPPGRAYALARAWCAVNIHALRWTCGLGWRIEGRENIPDRPCIFFAKHQSTWETMGLVALLPSQVHVIKRELLRIPFFGWGHARLRPIAIDRSAGRRAIDQVLAQGRERLAGGWNVMIFPEGTRVRPGETARYRMGGALLASATGAPVVPVAHNAGEFWPRHGFAKWPGEIRVVIGPAIETAGKDPDAINAEARQWLEATMDRIGGRGPYAAAA